MSDYERLTVALDDDKETWMEFEAVWVTHSIDENGTVIISTRDKSLPLTWKTKLVVPRGMWKYVRYND